MKFYNMNKVFWDYMQNKNKNKILVQNLNS